MLHRIFVGSTGRKWISLVADGRTGMLATYNPNAMSKTPLDKDLWVEFDGDCPGKHYLRVNPHTFAGRITAWCPRKRTQFNISAGDIIRASHGTICWVKGYLEGSTPDPPPEPIDTRNGTDEPWPAYQAWLKAYDHWRKSARQFARSGYWNHANRACEKCGEQLLHSRPELTCENCGTPSVGHWLDSVEVI